MLGIVLFPFSLLLVIAAAAGILLHFHDLFDRELLMCDELIEYLRM